MVKYRVPLFTRDLATLHDADLDLYIAKPMWFFGKVIQDLGFIRPFAKLSPNHLTPVLNFLFGSL